MKRYIMLFFICLFSVALYGCGFSAFAVKSNLPTDTVTTDEEIEISNPPVTTTTETTAPVIPLPETTDIPVPDVQPEDDGSAPGTVNITQISSSRGRVTLSWEKNQCSGYILSYQNDKIWVEVTTFTDPDTTECTVGNLEDSTFYRFKICAYNIDENGVKKLGAVSDVASVMTPDSSGKMPVVTALPKEPVTTTEAPKEEPKTPETYGGYIIIGDSRIVGMSQAGGVKSSKENVKFIAKNSMGYKWFSTDALGSLDQYLEDNGDKYYKIVIAMGVNDVWNIDKYIACYKNMIDKYKYHELYFLSVNPIVDNKGFSCTNATIDSFNTRLKKAFPDCYIDTAKVLKKDGFDTPDGLHYSASTNVSIFNMILEYTDDSVITLS